MYTVCIQCVSSHQRCTVRRHHGLKSNYENRFSIEYQSKKFLKTRHCI